MILSLIVSSILSTIISVIIGNVVGIYYLKKLNDDWEELFRNIEVFTFEEIKNHIKRGN